MLDVKFIRSNLELVRSGAERKRIKIDFDALEALDDERRALIGEQERLRAERNTAGKEIAGLKGDAKQEKISAMAAVSTRIEELTKRLAVVTADLDHILARVPNPPSPEVPDGKDDTENVEIRRWGTVREFPFEPRDHVDLATALGIVDFQRAARISGPRMYILMGEGAILELAVLRFALDHLVRRGFAPMIVPTLVKHDALFGTAYFPGGEEQAYACERDELWLAGTSEVPVTAFHAGEILEEKDLPRHYAGYSTCYRREAGAAGRDTRGLYRIHQFNKVEQVVICRNDEEESLRCHRLILDNAEQILQALELPYRVVNVCTGDLGQGQIQKFDVECWMPSRGGWGETHSASRFHDFQARRLDLRYRDGEGKVRFCHTLNNTAIATPRVLIPILENNQEEDGSVRIPKALVPYMGGVERLTPRGAS